MKREDLEKMNNPTWKAAYENALGRAETLGTPDYDARAFASVSADLAVEQVKAELARAEAQMSASDPSVEPTDPGDVDLKEVPTADAAAGWKKAVSGINARRGNAHNIGQEKIQSTVDRKRPFDQAKTETVSTTSGRNGWVKATSQINARR